MDCYLDTVKVNIGNFWAPPPDNRVQRLVLVLGAPQQALAKQLLITHTVEHWLHVFSQVLSEPHGRVPCWGGLSIHHSPLVEAPRLFPDRTALVCVVRVGGSTKSIGYRLLVLII